MRKYIKASVDAGADVHVDGEWVDYLPYDVLCNSRIVVSMSFDEPVVYMEVDSTPSDRLDTCLQFGMQIEGGMIVVPQDLEFEILKGDIYATFYISHNGVDLDWTYFDGYSCCIKFTEFGYKCYLASESLGKSFDEVVKTILTYREYFDIK